jgi:hypothetical protein
MVTPRVIRFANRSRAYLWSRETRAYLLKSLVSSQLRQGSGMRASGGLSPTRTPSVARNELRNRAVNGDWSSAHRAAVTTCRELHTPLVAEDACPGKAPLAEQRVPSTVPPAAARLHRRLRVATDLVQPGPASCQVDIRPTWSRMPCSRRVLTVLPAGRSTSPCRTQGDPRSRLRFLLLLLGVFRRLRRGDHGRAPRRPDQEQPLAVTADQGLPVGAEG